MKAGDGRERCSKRPLARREGQSASEFIIVAPVLLALILGAIQFGLIYQARATLNQAAFQVARAGAINGGDSAKMKEALVIWLTPLFTFGKTATDIKTGYARAKSEVDKYGHIERISPDDAVFTDFGDPLPNDNLMYRSTAPGSASGLSVQEANMLKVKVVYCYKLIVPLVNTMIDTFAQATTAYKTYCTGRADRNIPIVTSAVMRMQSPLRK